MYVGPKHELRGNTELANQRREGAKGGAVLFLTARASTTHLRIGAKGTVAYGPTVTKQCLTPEGEGGGGRCEACWARKHDARTVTKATCITLPQTSIGRHRATVYPDLQLLLPKHEARS